MLGSTMSLKEYIKTEGIPMRRNSSDFMKRRAAMLEEEAKEKVVEKMAEVAQEGFGDDVKDSGRESLPRELATAYYEQTSSWMHRFSDVRSDKKGFFILHDDNPDAWRMKKGDLLQDVALNQDPYWIVVDNDRFGEKRVDIDPFGNNPFLTGVGAGGAKIYPEDMKVLTGDYDIERIELIRDFIREGKATSIDQVSYMLLGTVPTNFGPNGPQGGWYNAGDSFSNRAGRQGIRGQDVVIADAKILIHNGFFVSEYALSGAISAYQWTKFVESPVGFFRDWRDTIPYDFDAFRELSMDYYERRGLLKDDYRRRELPKRIDRHIRAAIIWNQSGGMSYDEIESSSYDYDIKRFLEEFLNWEIFSTIYEDPYDIDNAITMLQHKQSDIQARASGRCMMCFNSSYGSVAEKCYEALVDFIDSKKGHWLVNEHIINFAKDLGDEGTDILLAAANLPDAENRKYAYWGLSNLGHRAIRDAIFTEDNPVALGAIVSAMVGSYGKKRKYSPGRHETYFLIEKLIPLLDPSESVITRFNAKEALSNIMMLAIKQELDVSEARKAIVDYDKEIRRNPEDRLDDEEWIDLTLSKMLDTVD
jgi:hypothetical protein